MLLNKLLKINTDSMVLKQILTARENRNQLRINIAKRDLVSISLTLNIPGFPKSNELYHTFFEVIKKEIQIFYKARSVELKEEYNINDIAGDFFIASVLSKSVSSHHLKKISEKFELEHKLGRFIDIDIFDINGNPISSERIKECFFCLSYSAIDCMRSNRHSYEELREYQKIKIKEYLECRTSINICRELSSLALRSILYEVSLTPKPGLVDFNSSGVHKDMNYFTFLNSSSSISQYFFKIAMLGYRFKNDFSEALPVIRENGLQMENDMYISTNNVNTQKGIIFLLSVALFASAYIIANNDFFNITNFSQISKKIGKALISELDKPCSVKTHGQICFEKYGKDLGGGARYEVANGFKTTINSGYLLLSKVFPENLNFIQIQQVLQKVLFSIIANNNDTNVLYRSNLEILKELKQIACISLNSKKYDEKKLLEFCKEKNISPGGSADLLAVSIFLYFVNKKYVYGS